MYAALDFALAIGLNLAPDSGARIFVFELLRELRKQFAGAFVPRVRGFDRHLHDLVAAPVAARVQNAFFAEAESLPVPGAVRDLEDGPAVDGGHLDLRAQRRLPNRQRHGDFDIVAVAAEEWVLVHLGGDVEIARRRAHRARVAL